MSSKTITYAIVGALLFAGIARAEPANGLNVVVTSADRQVQMMAMVLSMQTMTRLEAPVYIAFCGAAGDLALQATTTDTFAPSDKSPSMLLRTLIEGGATVQICPLYLPSAGKTPADLIPGIEVARPADMAARLLDRDLQNLSF